MSTTTGPQDAFALGRSNLNGFLFASIGIEGSGMPLSVISALARQGLDPWQEARRLAALPRTVAADGLARLIAAMPAGLWPMPDAAAIAARLVALLPRHDGEGADASTTYPDGDVGRTDPWLIVALVVVTLLGAVAAYVVRAPAEPYASSPPTSASLNSIWGGG